MTEGNGQATSTLEPDTVPFTRNRPEPSVWVKRWRKYRAKPVWQQGLIAVGVAGALGYISWTYAAGPVIQHRVDAAVAGADIDARVKGVFDRDSKAFTDAVIARVDERVRDAQNGLPPVVVQKADLQAMLSCPLTSEAKLFIGADAKDPTHTGLDPARQEQVAAAVRQAGAQGTPETAMRVVPVGAELRVTTDANQGARLIDCSPAAVAATTTTTAPVTAVTPPPNAN